jgi:hypothetical protein
MSFNNIITVSHHEAANIILAESKDATVHVSGEPGIGKTQLERILCARMGYRAVRIDVPSKSDTSDFGSFVPNRDIKAIEFWGSPYYAWESETPHIYNLDEFSKGNNAVKTMLHGLLDTPRRVGDILINPESIVYSTGNLGTDGVGDAKLAHTQGRITEIYLRKPNSEQWIQWGVVNGVNAIVLAWADREPSILASYLDSGQENNQFIFNPKRAASSINKAYVSPRSLFKASRYVTAFEEGRLAEHELLAALQGCIGGAGAGSLSAFVAVAHEVPSPREIARTPGMAKVPVQPGAVAMTALGALQWVNEVVQKRLTIDDMTKGEVVNAWLTYFVRLPKEAQSLFMVTAQKGGDNRTGTRESIELWEAITQNPKYGPWAQANMHMFK